MRKLVPFALALTLLVGNAAWAATAKPAAKPVVKPVVNEAPAVVRTASVASTPSQNVDAMKPGLSYNFLMDVKVFNFGNPTFASSNATSSWYFYPVYRAMVANVFENNFAIYADIEKPGYANITYPSLKVNELYGKYQQGNFYAQLGRQVFGDTDDLLLGFQNDAITFGFDLKNINIKAFVAKTALYMPWGGTMEGMFGLVPEFAFTDTMSLRAYALFGSESILVTSGTPPTTSDKVNMLITLGAKYLLDMPIGENGSLGAGAQMGVQFANAQTAAAASIDATNVGFKVDAGFSNLPPDGFGFNGKVHMVYTGGVDTTATTIKCPFISTNSLVGSGPGLFSKIEDGAGPYTYLDSTAYGARVQQYAGVFALGITAGIDVVGLDAGAGFWTYIDTFHYDPVPNTSSLGSELDFEAGYRLLKALRLYAQLGLYLPPNPTNASPAPGLASKVLLGSTLMFYVKDATPTGTGPGPVPGHPEGSTNWAMDRGSGDPVERG